MRPFLSLMLLVTPLAAATAATAAPQDRTVQTQTVAKKTTVTRSGTSHATACKRKYPSYNAKTDRYTVGRVTKRCTL